MRFRLRTLLIATTIGPPILAGMWLFAVWLGIDPVGPLILGIIGYGGLATLAVAAHLWSPQKR